DLQTAELEEARAAGVVDQARAAEQEQRQALARVEAHLRAVEKVLAETDATPAAVPVEHQEELERRFHAARTRRAVTYDTIDRVATTVSGQLVDERDTAQAAARRAEDAITAVARDFRLRWPALAGDLTPE